MIICNKITDEKDIQHNDKWAQIPDHQYKILTFGGSETSKSNALLNLIYERWGIDKICLYVKDLKERKHKYLINKQNEVGINDFNAQMHLSRIQMILMMYYLKLLPITTQLKTVKYKFCSTIWCLKSTFYQEILSCLFAEEN